MQNPFLRFREDADLKDELGAHFDALVEEGVESGLTVEEARRRARLRIGSPQAVVENVREGEFSTMLESWYRDFMLGLRSLKRNPVFSVTAILTLAVGIGANTVIFTLLYGLLLRSLPVKDSGQLVQVGILSTSAKGNNLTGIPYLMLPELRRLRSFTGVVGWSGRSVSMSTADGGSQLILAGLVDHNGFEMLGLNAHLGRLLMESDDVRGGPTDGWPVVLSYGFWKDNFGSDPTMIGKQLKLANTMVTVVGVTPPDFLGVLPGSQTKIYLPLQFLAVVQGNNQMNELESLYTFSTIGRLKHGVSMEEAQAEIAVYQKSLLGQFIPQKFRELPWVKTASLKVKSARTGLPTFFRMVYSTPLYLMQGLVGIVLLLCCVNVGGLMMSKVYARRQEFAIRTAIGAARWRLIRQYLTESFVIALVGAALGAVAAWYGTSYLLPFFRHPNEGVGMSIQPDRTVLYITGFFAVLTTLLFGTLPAWRAGGADPGSLLKSRTTGASRRQILGRAFIPIQVALSFALISIATLLSQSLIQLETERTGFDLDRVTIQTAPLHMLGLKDEVKLSLYHRMRNRLNEMPGLTSASFTYFTPMTSFQPYMSVQAIADGPNPPEDPHMTYNDVGPGYFRTMKTSILAGREFEEHEQDRSVCILNQSAAAFFFPRGNALGGYVRSDITATPSGATCRVIGIAQDAKFANLNEPPPRTLYFPVSLTTMPANLVFLLNAPTKTEAIAAYRTVREELSPTTPYVLFVTLREQMDAALGSQKALSLMSNFFAGLALFLSGLGLYGLLSSSVTQRTSEIGVRMALGAERGKVLWMILSDALGLLIAGLALGAILLVIAIRFVEKLFYGVSAFDPLRLLVITSVLATITILAGLIPALRAASVDPIQALRSE